MVQTLDTFVSIHHVQIGAYPLLLAMAASNTVEKILDIHPSRTALKLHREKMCIAAVKDLVVGN